MRWVSRAGLAELYDGESIIYDGEKAIATVHKFGSNGGSPPWRAVLWIKDIVAAHPGGILEKPLGIFPTLKEGKAAIEQYLTKEVTE